MCVAIGATPLIRDGVLLRPGDLLNITRWMMDGKRDGCCVHSVEASEVDIVVGWDLFCQFQQSNVGGSAGAQQAGALHRLAGRSVSLLGKVALCGLVVEHEDPAVLSAEAVVCGEEQLTGVLCSVVDHCAGAATRSSGGEDHCSSIDLISHVEVVGVRADGVDVARAGVAEAIHDLVVDKADLEDGHLRIRSDDQLEDDLLTTDGCECHSAVFLVVPG